MLDIGFLELMLIGVVGLLVLGPERLPRAARTAGMWIGKIKRTVSGMQREISAQLEAEELRQKLNEQQKKLDDSLKKAKLDVESIADSPSEKASATPNDTEQRVAKASSRLDDALKTVREETPPSSPAPSSTAPLREAEAESAESEETALKKDRNHQ
ncbi:twin-arginine translocase subunit TatB [Vreelandella sulfidaeris]|uniref:Sec-independent protein translocase protein TatB n=1 Tax=Vreelandella sulfidaeris TaxID=115553 RepID=A0A365TQ39_9GAMM|nr:Sec-independent protein translocase protein TatB [Halomonas sulfidaeris]RBI68033.1 twin-arginine translocase subunit TatB [Halomonas sulfidaeris]